MRGEAGGARRSAGGGGTRQATGSTAYPPISAAYWLPPSNPTPYHVPAYSTLVSARHIYRIVSYRERHSRRPLFAAYNIVYSNVKRSDVVTSRPMYLSIVFLDLWKAACVRCNRTGACAAEDNSASRRRPFARPARAHRTPRPRR
ncbi:hypothetical protein EVAR_88833_1 [Eumeta japonica]|uniref:Uncharacterized protein n=1 Tax=Eumeta variegata TaxID=151549 RepID=A0A4C1Y7W8_EUMVA|nr:hypothetical protein EVAR_88833_1 [Eumeta japonica]